MEGLGFSVYAFDISENTIKKLNYFKEYYFTSR